MEVEVSLRMILGQIEKEQLEGNHVCLDEFGSFSLTAECRYVENKKIIPGMFFTVIICQYLSATFPANKAFVYGT